MFLGNLYRTVNALFENYVLELTSVDSTGLASNGTCVLVGSKAPTLFKNTAHELCHIDARIAYFNAFIDCHSDPDPSTCCAKVAQTYCDAAEACDKAAGC